MRLKSILTSTFRSPGPRANLANLIEAIRAREPRAVIELNSHFRDIWPLMKAGDGDVARALRDANVVCVEFGVGPTSGINSAQDYGEFTVRGADGEPTGTGRVKAWLWKGGSLMVFFDERNKVYGARLKGQPPGLATRLFGAYE